MLPNDPAFRIRSMTTVKTGIFLVVATLAIALSPVHSSAQEDSGRESFYRAVEYCRGNVSRPIALSADRHVLCIDGAIAKDTDISLARSLKEGGLAVVRGSGGNDATIIALSDLIDARRATVVVHDYCLSACAAFFLIASQQTFVVKDTLVAWRFPERDDAGRPPCISLRPPPGGGPKKWRSVPCRDDSSEARADRATQQRFFRERAVSPFFEAPPDSLHVRRIIASWFAETGGYRNVAWTIHPRFYPSLFKTKIIVESYPQDQDEVDEMVSRLHLGAKVIHDP